MPTRIQDLFVYFCLLGVLILAFLGINGCAAPPPPRPDSWQDRVDVTSAVYLEGDGVACSGVAIDDHLVLTARHCVDGSPMTVALPTPGDNPRPIVGAHLDPVLDLAWLTIGGDPLPVQARIAPRPPVSGELVFGAGFGCFQTLAVYPGLHIDQLPIGDAYAMAICPGDSGGPVFNDGGEVVGILSSRSTQDPIAIAVRP